MDIVEKSNYPEHRRPLSVSLVAWMVFIVTILNFLRLGLTLYNWEFLTALLSTDVIFPIFPAYLVATGLFWVVIGLPLAWGIWRGNRWAPRLFLAELMAYSIYYWADRVFLPGYPQRNSDWSFAVGLNLLILVWSLWIMTRRKTKGFFGEVYER
jgi:hypothetical protein